MYDRDVLLAATDLGALADDVLGPHVGPDQHSMWPCPSPTHAQTGRTPPVSVFTSRWGEERWHCHGCGDGGTAIDLLMRARDTGPRAALDELGQRAGISPMPYQPPSGSNRRPSRFVEQILEQLHLAEQTVPEPAHLEQIATYVDACARELWTPAGGPARRWLTERRGLPEGVLRANRVGADLGHDETPRPDGMCSHVGAAILPVHACGRPIYFQARVLHPAPGRPRYLNPTAQLAPNPKLSVIEPDVLTHPEIIVTEGAIDALTAAAAGYRSAAVLSAGYPDRHVALQLARLDGELILALDPDAAGQKSTMELAAHLEELQRPATILLLGAGDLNEACRCSPDWSSELAERIAHSSPIDRADGLEIGS